ncbi:MAG: GldG family protein, partial [Myxococcota bacterium]
MANKASNIANSSTLLIAVIGIIVVVNVMLNINIGQPLRFDLTENKIYTLSEGSRKMVGNLEQELLIKLFISENLQYPDHTLEQRVGDLLQEYAITSNGKLKYEIIHPKDSDPPAEGPEGAAEETSEETADAEEGPRGFGIQKIPVGQRSKDEVALRMVYKGMAILYGDKQEVIKELRGTDNLEYEISKRIKILTTAEAARNTVGFVGGYGGPVDSPQFIQSINGAFSQIYGELLTAEAVNLAQDKTVPDNVNALVILNPQQPVDDEAKYVIDQFLMKGKGVAWLQTTMAPDPKMPMLPTRQPVLTGLAPMFESYGLKLNQDLVLDRTNSIVALTFTDRGIAPVSNPTMPLFTDINDTSVITRDIPTLCFPLASTLTVSANALENKELDVIELVKTAKTAVRRDDLSSLSYEQIQKESDSEEKGPFLVAAGLQGALKSHWSGKERPGTAVEGETRLEASTAA